jgi:hypothetical protein
MSIDMSEGAPLKDDTVIESELLMAATAHSNQQYVARLYLGGEVVDRIGPLVIRTI